MKKLQRLVSFEVGFDCEKYECKFGSKECKPGEGGFHGKHGLDIRFVVKGQKGAIQFLLSTNWYPKDQEDSNVSLWSYERMVRGPLPVDLGYHSIVPMYEGQTAFGPCDLLDGDICYYDGSSLQAEKPYYILINAGEHALWKYLEGVYEYRFNGAKWPKPEGYPTPKRGTK